MDTNELKQDEDLDIIVHAPYGDIVVSGIIFLVLLTALVLVGIV